MPHFRCPTGCEHRQTIDGDADPEGGADPVGVATKETDDAALRYDQGDRASGPDS